MPMQVNIVSAESEIYSGDAEMIFAPAVQGEVGIAPGHSALLTRMVAGEVRVKHADGSEEGYYVSGGLLEIQPHLVSVLSDTAVRARDLDEAAAQEARRQAEEALEDRSAEIDYAKARAELAEAMAQLQAIERLRKRGR